MYIFEGGEGLFGSSFLPARGPRMTCFRQQKRSTLQESEATVVIRQYCAILSFSELRSWFAVLIFPFCEMRALGGLFVVFAYGTAIARCVLSTKPAFTEGGSHGPPITLTWPG